MKQCVKSVRLSVISKTNSTQPIQQYDLTTGRLYLDSVSYEDAAIFNTDMFDKIFGERKYQYQSRRFVGLLPIVKISYKRRTIYRRVELVSKTNFTNDIVALPPKAIGELTNMVNNNGYITADRPLTGDMLKITPGCTFGFYWNHPNSATRVSYRLGLPSLLIGITSFAIGIISLFC